MSSHSLPIGAHLTTPRFGYAHHGIYAGNGRVIHYPGFKQFFRRARGRLGYPESAEFREMVIEPVRFSQKVGTKALT